MEPNPGTAVDDTIAILEFVGSSHGEVFVIMNLTVIQAAKKGYKFGWLNCIAREQPLTSVAGLWSQGKRWTSGTWSTGNWRVRLIQVSTGLYYLFWTM
jgi:hypothetical protein